MVMAQTMISRPRWVGPAPLGVGKTALQVVAALPALLPTLVALEIRVFRPVHAARARIAAGEEPVSALLAHDADPIPPFRVGRQRLLQRDTVARLARHFLPDEDHVLGLSSRVELVEGRRHLLILDFVVPPSAQALDQIVRGVKLAGWRGAVMETGSSYHFIGTETLTTEAWTSAMGRALLLSDLIDVRYMGHALARGVGTARLTSCSSKPHAPRVVAVVR